MLFSKNRLKLILPLGLFYILTFTLPVFAILKNPHFVFSLKAFVITDFLRRYSALVALVLLSFQVFLGAFLPLFAKRFGEGVYRFHQQNGVLTYCLLFLHPLSYFVYIFLGKGLLDPFFVYSDFCLICETRPDLYLTFGRFAFWFASAALLAASLRRESWWRENWKYLHVLNYLVFVLVAVHAWLLGSDVHGVFFAPLFFLALLCFLVSVFYKFTLLIKKK